VKKSVCGWYRNFKLIIIKISWQIKHLAFFYFALFFFRSFKEGRYLSYCFVFSKTTLVLKVASKVLLCFFCSCFSFAFYKMSKKLTYLFFFVCPVFSKHYNFPKERQGECHCSKKGDILIIEMKENFQNK